MFSTTQQNFNYVVAVSFIGGGFKVTTLVVIGTDCRGSCKSNYHTMTMTTHAVNQRIKNL